MKEEYSARECAINDDEDEEGSGSMLERGIPQMEVLGQISANVRIGIFLNDLQLTCPKTT